MKILVIKKDVSWASLLWLFLRWAGYALLIIPVGLVVVGMLYQRLGEFRDMREYLPPGTLVDVGGHRLHIHCLGQGTPTVVLEAGLMHGSLAWSLVQPDVARFTRVCAYDRAGLGWSDPGPNPRTPRRIAHELHTLLDKSGNKGPYVLVGHSIGGLYARVYTGAYPNDVVGMVLVDAVPEQSWRWIPTGFVWEQGIHQIDWNAYSRPLQARLGLTRLRGLPSGGVEMLPSSVRATGTVLGLRSHAYDWTLYEGPAVKETGEQVWAVGSLPNIPLFVLFAVATPPPGVSYEQVNDRQQEWQVQLAQLSPQGKYLPVRGSGHFIHVTRPEAVVSAIRQTVELARCNMARQ